MEEKLQLKIEIEKRELRIRNLEAQIWEEKKKIEVIEEIIERCLRQKKKIEDSLSDAIEESIRRGQAISRYPVFNERYQNRMKRVIYGQETSESLSIFDKAVRRLYIKVDDSLEEINIYKKDINNLEQEIYLFKQRLKEVQGL